MADSLRSIPQPTEETEEQRLARKAEAMGLSYAPRTFGGLSMDSPVVAKSVKQISSGLVDEDTVKIWQKRNPKVAGVYGKAFEAAEANRRNSQRLQEIMGRNISPAQPAFAPIPDAAGPLQAGGDRRQIAEGQAAQRAQFNPQAAIGQLAQEQILTPDTQKLVGDVAQQFAAPKPVKREFTEDITGRKRFVDTGEKVFPMVGEKPLTQEQKDKAAARKDKILKTRFDNEKDLRKEFFKDAGEFMKVRDSFARIEESAKKPSAAGDLSMIFNYMKMLDPGSVVRESEFATAAASGSLGDRFVAVGAKLMAGKRLSPTQRADFEDRAKKLFKRQNLQHSQRKRFFSGVAKRNKLNPLNIVADIDLATEDTEAAATAPKGVDPETWKFMTPEEKALFL